MCELHWTEYFRSLGPTLVAAVVAYIAFQQWKINRDTLREKLFDRRWAVFEETRDFLYSLSGSAKADEVKIKEFVRTCQTSRYLFSEDLSAYLEQIRHRAIDLNCHQKMLQGSTSQDERSRLLEREAEDLKWLLRQSNEFFSAFSPYLSFGKR